MSIEKTLYGPHFGGNFKGLRELTKIDEQTGARNKFYLMQFETLERDNPRLIDIGMPEGMIVPPFPRGTYRTIPLRVYSRPIKDGNRTTYKLMVSMLADPPPMQFPPQNDETSVPMGYFLGGWFMKRVDRVFNDRSLGKRTVNKRARFRIAESFKSPAADMAEIEARWEAMSEDERKADLLAKEHRALDEEADVGLPDGGADPTWDEGDRLMIPVTMGAGPAGIVYTMRRDYPAFKAPSIRT